MLWLPWKPVQSNHSITTEGSVSPGNLRLLLWPPESTICNVPFLSCFVQTWRLIAESQTAACPLALVPVVCVLVVVARCCSPWAVTCYGLMHGWSHLRPGLAVCSSDTRCSGTGKQEHWLFKQDPSRSLTRKWSILNCWIKKKLSAVFKQKNWALKLCKYCQVSGFP